MRQRQGSGEVLEVEDDEGVNITTNFQRGLQSLMFDDEEIEEGLEETSHEAVYEADHEEELDILSTPELRERLARLLGPGGQR